MCPQELWPILNVLNSKQANIVLFCYPASPHTNALLLILCSIQVHTQKKMNKLREIRIGEQSIHLSVCFFFISFHFITFLNIFILSIRVFLRHSYEWILFIFELDNRGCSSSRQIHRIPRINAFDNVGQTHFTKCLINFIVQCQYTNKTYGQHNS